MGLLVAGEALGGTHHHGGLFGEGRGDGLGGLGRGGGCGRRADGGGEEAERGEDGGPRAGQREPHDGGSSTRWIRRGAGASISLRPPDGQRTSAEAARPAGPRPKTTSNWFCEA